MAQHLAAHQGDGVVQAQVPRQERGQFALEAVGLHLLDVGQAAEIGNRVLAVGLEILEIVEVGRHVQTQPMVEKLVLQADFQRVDLFGLEHFGDVEGAGIEVGAAGLDPRRPHGIAGGRRREVVFQLELAGQGVVLGFQRDVGIEIGRDLADLVVDRAAGAGGQAQGVGEVIGALAIGRP